MKKIKKVATLLTFVIALFFLLTFSGKAETKTFIRTCKYVKGNEVLYVKWEIGNYNDVIKYIPQVYNDEGKKIGSLSNYEMKGGYDNFVKETGYGCMNYIFNSLGDKYLMIDRASKPEETYKFNGIVTEKNDIYNAGVYEDELNGDTTITGGNYASYQQKNITCSYKLSNNKEVEITVNTNGMMSVYHNYGGNAIVAEPYTFFSVLEESRKCPATICYSEVDNIFAGLTDYIYFSNDINYSCPSNLKTNTTSNRKEIFNGEEVSTYPTKADAIKRNSIIEDYIKKSGSLLSCYYNKVDTAKKCNTKYSNYNKICTSNAGFLNYEECTKEIQEYLKCIDENYQNEKNECTEEYKNYNDSRKEMIQYAEDNPDDVVIKKATRAAGYNFGAGDIEEGDCESILGSDTLRFLREIYLYIVIAGVVLVVVLGILDFSKAAASGEADAMKKAFKAFTRRLIALVILILLPVLIQFVLDIANIEGLNNTDPLCNRN